MKIALIGYGKMGKAIEEIALQQGDEIVLKICADNKNDLTKKNLAHADVAIEFTNADSVITNLKLCFNAELPVVCGTTGWLAHLDELKNYCNIKNGSFLYASNFSVGVNLFFVLNIYLASLMKHHEEYNVNIEEIHHTQKKDAPSGTAITLAEQIIQNIQAKNNWVNNETVNKKELEIISKRIDEVPGIHAIKYYSPVDDIEIIHTAHNRKGFAAGALLAAKFIAAKKGIFSMQDVLGI